ncbi:hypothetical protein V6N13_020227 [Hibiscus sabdariffa]
MEFPLAGRWRQNLRNVYFKPVILNLIQNTTEYYTWFLENGKTFLVSVEVENKWREDLRCSKHRHLTSEFGQSFEEPTDEPTFACSSGWPSLWNSMEDPLIHVRNHPWEQPPFSNVLEQPPMYDGRSSSQHAYTDDGDDQSFNDEQTPDQPRRVVHPLRRYDQTSSIHRQELPKRRQK